MLFPVVGKGLLTPSPGYSLGGWNPQILRWVALLLLRCVPHYKNE